MAALEACCVSKKLLRDAPHPRVIIHSLLLLRLLAETPKYNTGIYWNPVDGVLPMSG